MPEPEDEVSEEMQAAMALKLMDNVRKMIREEMKAALQDFTFMNDVYWETLLNELVARYEYRFNDAVKSVVKRQMEKY